MITEQRTALYKKLQLYLRVQLNNLTQAEIFLVNKYFCDDHMQKKGCISIAHLHTQGGGDCAFFGEKRFLTDPITLPLPWELFDLTT